jgi:DNA-binding LytR/AlgR family response regulator
VEKMQLDIVNCVAIDNLSTAHEMLREFCSTHKNIQLLTFSFSQITPQKIVDLKPDIVILDIEPNDMLGLSIAKSLPKSACLILTSQNSSYANDAYEVNAVDFLVKPYTIERLARAIEKAEKWLKMHSLFNAAMQRERVILIKSEYRNIPVSIDKIVYIESNDNYVKLYLTDGTTILSKMPLRSVAKKLPVDEFLRIHRSYIVALNAIESFTRTEITLTNSGKTIPIGKTYADDVIKAFNKPS